MSNVAEPWEHMCEECGLIHVPDPCCAGCACRVMADARDEILRRLEVPPVVLKPATAAGIAKAYLMRWWRPRTNKERGQ